MTFTEFLEQNLEYEECPINIMELCLPACQGFSYDPPCSFANPDQDMVDWIVEKEEIARNEK